MGSFVQDIRYAVRSFRRTPGTTLIVILTLALGIGATTAIFTLMNGVMLSRLPVPDASGLLLLGRGRACCVNGGVPKDFDLFSYQQYLQLRDNNPYFTGIAAVRARADNLQLRVPGRSGPAQTASSRLVSANYFSLLGVSPALGRGFVAGEDVGEGAHPVAVISDRFCKKVFNGSPQASVGATVIANGVALTIVGVMPPGFFGETVEADPPDMWIPLSMQPTIMSRRALFNDPDAFWLYPLARLKPGANVIEAQSWLKAQIQAHLAQVQGPDINAKSREDIARMNFEITSGEGGISRLKNSYAESLKILMAMVAVLLVICCANVSNLLLARATARQQEIATRVALGASRSRIIRQVLTETALIGIAGGAAGLTLAFWAADFLKVLAFRTSYIPVKTSPDLRVLCFTAIAVLAATFIAGLGPAWHTARTSLSASSRTMTQTENSKFSLGSFLVVAQVSGCLVLVVVAGLFARSLNRLVDQDFGFNTRVLDVRFDPDKAGYKFKDLPQLYRELENKISRLNGVEAVTYAQYAPFSDNWSSTLVIPGYVSASGGPPEARWLRVGPRYAEIMGLQLLSGRDIGSQDTPESPNVAVVNDEFVRQYLGNREPLGMEFAFQDATDKTKFRIVGVVKGTKYQSVKEETIPPTFFIPAMQKSGLSGTADGSDDSMYAKDILVRTSDRSAHAADAVRNAVLEVNSEMPIRYVRTVKEQLVETVRGDQTIQRLSAYFGVFALLLASIGLYGLMMYGVARRTREMGIRFALGAKTVTVIGMIMRQSMMLVLAGIAVGIPLTWAGGKIASGKLYGVSPADPLVFGTAILVMSIAAAIAAYLPARRASRVDPAVVLRAE
jgi:predicted permease